MLPEKLEHEYSTVVYVTDQFKCENLIKAGREIADETKTNLYVVNVSSHDFKTGQVPDLEALEFLFQVSHSYNAIMNVFYEKNVTKVLRDTTQDFNAVNIVTGVPQSRGSVLMDFWSTDAELNFYVIDESGKAEKIEARLKKAKK